MALEHHRAPLRPASSRDMKDAAMQALIERFLQCNTTSNPDLKPGMLDLNSLWILQFQGVIG